MGVELKSAEDLRKMRRAGAIVAEVLDRVCERVRPGVATKELDEVAERETLARGAVPAFKGYRVGQEVFPASLCVSVNDEIVHGIPSDRELLEGDIVSLDFGVVIDGFYGDSARTLPVGAISSEIDRLVSVTRESLHRGIEMMRAGNRIGDVGASVQETVEAAGYSVVREFVGHGIGRKLHEEPQVPNYGEPGKGRLLREGMVLAIEPMVNAGSAGVRLKSDGWTATTKDGSWSAHFEHSVAITANGPEILTVC